jgi:hypothetical protein
MIDTTNWKYFYKIYETWEQPTNLLYTPLISPGGDVMCLWWDETSPYQSANTRLTAELINFFFEREVRYLTIFQEYPWAPKILEIDLVNRKIFIEFNKETLNHIIFTPGRNLDIECPNWKEQIFTILSDIVNGRYYKMALYPHCFFIDNTGKIKTIDFYGCVSQEERYLERSKIEGMIGNDSGGRFNEVTKDGLIDFEMFFKNTLSVHLTKVWPDSPFAEYYKRLYD